MKLVRPSVPTRSRQVSRAPASVPSQQKRGLHVHEYLAQALMRDSGIKVIPGVAIKTPAEAAQACTKLGGQDWFLKAQVLAGGRGKGKFDSGFKGGVHMVSSPQEASDLASKMLGHRLITKQTGAEGRPCDTLYVVPRTYIRRERYLAIVMDRSYGGPVIVASSQGGMDIEQVAHENPSAIVKVPVDIIVGITQQQADTVADALLFTGQQKQDAAEEVKKLYKLFVANDATLVEINPFVETADGQVVSLDAKINFDDNALYKHKELSNMRDWSQEDAREIQASKFDLNYIGLDGNIACMVNGAGLAMATMDMIKLHGGEPANFLDVGGGASETQVTEAFKILNADKKVDAILVNIFGGIMRCDVIASGIIKAAQEIGLKKPLVVRLQGTNVKQAKELLEGSTVKVLTADDLDQAAAQAVKVAHISRLASEAKLAVKFELPI